MKNILTLFIAFCVYISSLIQTGVFDKNRGSAYASDVIQNNIETSENAGPRGSSSQGSTNSGGSPGESSEGSPEGNAGENAEGEEVDMNLGSGDPDDQTTQNVGVSGVSETGSSGQLFDSTWLGLIVASFAPGLIMACPNGVDTYPFAGSAVFFLFKEIMSWKEYGDASKEIIREQQKYKIENEAYADFAQGRDGLNTQITAFTSLANLSRAAADSLEKRIKAHKILRIGTLASIGVAAGLIACDAASFGACSQAMVCPAVMGASFPDAINQTVASTIGNFSASTFGAVAGGTTLLGAVFKGLNDMIGDDSDDKWEKLFIITLGVTLALLIQFSSVVNRLKELMSNVYTRISVYGVFSEFVRWSKKSHEEAHRKLKRNADKYEGLARDLQRKLDIKDGRVSAPGGRSNITFNQPGSDYDSVGGPQERERGTCATGELSELRIDEDCKCREDNSCSKVEFPEMDFGQANFPSLLGETMNGLGNGINQSFAGNTEKAEAQFGKLNDKKAALNRLTNDMFEKVKKEMKKKGKDLNSDKIAGHLKDSMEKTLGQGLDKINNENPKILAALNNPGFDAAIPEDVKDKVKETIEEQEDNGVKSASIKEDKKSSNSGFNSFEFDSDFEESDGKDGQKLNQANALENFETNESDIRNEPGTNIFDVITTRYFKSAFPRFFEEQKKKNNEKIQR